jgi:hypothetical protein
MQNAFPWQILVLQHASEEGDSQGFAARTRLKFRGGQEM